VQQGEQVIDLTALAGQRLVPGLTLPGDTPPSQAAFETALLDALRRLDPQRTVWLRMGLAGLGGLVLPPALRDALSRSTITRLEVPLNARALAWSDRLQTMGNPVTTLLQAISESTRPPSAATIEQWRSLTQAGKLTDVLTEIIKTCIDPRTEVAGWTGQVQVVRLASLTTEAVAAEVDDWLHRG
jgi:tRNA 2-selenouridine synthase